MTHIPRLMCLSCGEEALIEHTGEVVKVELKDGSPYYKVHTDSYRCPACGTVFAYAQPGTEPATHHFQPNFESYKHDSVVRFRS